MKNKREESYVKPQRINKGVGGTPFSHFYFPIILCDLLSIKSLMFHGASLLALSRSVLTFFLLIGKKMGERSPLFNQGSYVNVRGEEAVNRRVVEETTT